MDKEIDLVIEVIIESESNYQRGAATTNDMGEGARVVADYREARRAVLRALLAKQCDNLQAQLLEAVRPSEAHRHGTIGWTGELCVCEKHRVNAERARMRAEIMRIMGNE